MIKLEPLESTQLGIRKAAFLETSVEMYAMRITREQRFLNGRWSQDVSPTHAVPYIQKRFYKTGSVSTRC